MTIVNRTVPLALRTLGYSEAEIEQIEAHINENGTIVGAPGLSDEHLPVFDVAVGERAISHMGHIKMMAAAQPFISGAISKTVNLPESATVDDIADAYTEGWKARPEGARDLPRRLEDRAGAAHRRQDEQGRRRRPRPRRAEPERRRMPRERESITHKFSIAGHEGYITAGKYEDGSVGEIFLTDIGKEGSTLRGMMNAFATAISIGLQYGVPLETFVRKFSYMRFDPEGITGNPEIPFAKSMPDYIMRWLAQPLHRRHRRARGPRHPHPRGEGAQGGPAGADRAGDTARRQRPRERRTEMATANGAPEASRAAAEPVPPPRRSPTRRRSSRPGCRASTSARPASSAAA